MQLLFMKQWLSDSITRAVCWTLIHSLWQGLILAALAGLLVLFTRKSVAAFRYNMLAILFFVFMGVVVGTFIRELNMQGPDDGGVDLTRAGQTGQMINQLSLPDDPTIETYQEDGYIARFTGYFNQHASLVVAIWFLIFLAKAVKLMSGLVYIQRIKHHKVHAPDALWTNRMKELARTLGVKVPVRLLESELVKVPLVAGFLKPIILVPIGLLANLPAGQVEAILLHELAHIRRRDFLVNLAQSFAEILFFFNPAVLWLSSLLREEREHCCDDMAIAVTQSKTGYIHALVSFQEYQLENAPAYTMAFPGKKDHLLNRVKRIINNSNKTLDRAEKSFLVLCCSLICILSMVFAQTAPKTDPVKELTAQKSIEQPAEKDAEDKTQAEGMIKDESRDDGINSNKDQSGNKSAVKGATTGYKDTNHEVSWAERFNDPAGVSEGTTLSFEETKDGKPLQIYLLKRNNILYQVETSQHTVTRFKINGKVAWQANTPLYTSKLKEYKPLMTSLLAEYKKTYTPANQFYEPKLPVVPVVKDTMPVLRKGNNVLTGTITHDKGGKQYKITIDNNQATGLMIDGVKVPNEQLPEYRDLINSIFREMKADADQSYRDRVKQATDNTIKLANENISLQDQRIQLQQQLFDTNRKLDHLDTLTPGGKIQLRKPIQLKKQDRTVVDDIIDDMVSAGIITQTNPLSFKLNKNEFVVNEKQQPESLQRRFLEKYVKSPGNTYLYSRNGGHTSSTVIKD